MPTKRTRSRKKAKSQLKSDQWYRGCDQAPSVNRRTKKRTNTQAPAFYRTAKWFGLRGHVLDRDKRVCQYCGAVAIQADHVIPRSAGGADSIDNLVACCSSCNRVAGGRVFKTFEEKKWWLLATRKIQRNDLAFPVKRERSTPEVINVEPRPKPAKFKLPPPISKEHYPDIVKKAQARDQGRCIECKIQSRRIIQLTESKPLDINNAATMCFPCEKAARTIPPDQEVTHRQVSVRRAAGI